MLVPVAQWAVVHRRFPADGAGVLIRASGYRAHPIGPVLRRHTAATSPTFVEPDSSRRLGNDAREVWRATESGPPLRQAVIATADHPDLARGPRLSTRPFDYVITVVWISC